MRLEAESKASASSSPTTTPARSTSPGAGVPGGMGGMADMLRNMGGGGAGGMPDMASMMNNPQFMAMAQQLMANGGLANLMSNPAVNNMVRSLFLVFW